MDAKRLNIVVVAFILAKLWTEERKDMEQISILVGIYTQDNSQKIAVTGMEQSDGEVEMYFMGNSKIIKVMGMAIRSL